MGALLQNIGSMCLHQLHSDVLQWPMGSYVLQQQPCDLMHLMRITTILRRAMEARDTQSAVCCLVVLQVGCPLWGLKDCSSLLFLFCKYFCYAPLSSFSSANTSAIQHCSSPLLVCACVCVCVCVCVCGQVRIL